VRNRLIEAGWRRYHDHFTTERIASGALN